MKICVFGAGAVGGHVAARLAAKGHDVSVVARGPHLQKMKTEGIKLLHGNETIHGKVRTENPGKQDFVIVTLKANLLDVFADAAPPLLGPDTAVVFAQNGIPWWFFVGEGDRRLETVDPGGVIAASIPARHVIGCVVYPATSLEAPGVVRHVEGSRFSLAELDGARSERVTAIAGALASAGLRAPVQSRMREEIWLKLIGNATLNPVSALTRAGLAAMVGDPGTRQLVRAMMLEVEAVGKALGIEPGVGVDRRLEGAGRVGDHRTSMLQDVESGRPLEVEALVGSVVELAGQIGVAVPSLEVVYRLTRQLDRSLRGS